MSAIDRDHLLCERLKRHPHWRARVESLLEIVEDAAGDCEKADAAERRVIEELRQMGNAALTSWAERGVEKGTAVAQAEADWRPGGGKKRYWYTTFGQIEVIEPLWRNGTGIERPFSTLAGVWCRCSSLPLQRVMTDFGADHAFGRACAKLKEHDGIERPVSTIQRTTEQHAHQMYAQEAAREIRPGMAGSEIFVGERDGSMVPVVAPSPEAQDKRKGKVWSWKEVRVNRVHPHGSVSPPFGGNVAGGVEESGRQGWRCAAKAGFGPGSHLHAVGDGAPWIVNHVQMHFGRQGRYWVDFFPLCEYLGAAAKVCAPEHPQAWLQVQKERLKANQAAAVLDTLAPFVQADNNDDPVTAGDRYVRNRLDQLDYQGAIPSRPTDGVGGNRERSPLPYPRTA